MFGLTPEKPWDDESPLEGFIASQFAAQVAGAGQQAEGIVAGTRIATELGWRAVESIMPGDKVMTFDHGLREVVQVKRAALWTGRGSCPRHMMPLAVPEGALGNATPMLLLPEQNVMVESDLAEAVLGDPFALIPAGALEGYRGIERITPHQKVDICVLQFAQDEVVYANGTGMMHCGSIHAGRLEALLDAPDYAALPMDMARTLVKALIEEDAVAA
ncbi:MAG: Hint domain-containing protein [Paracoccaceae bacterium]|jgi:hypothetical protein